MNTFIENKIDELLALSENELDVFLKQEGADVEQELTNAQYILSGKYLSSLEANDEVINMACLLASSTMTPIPQSLQEKCIEQAIMFNQAHIFNTMIQQLDNT